jgi:hypothetical protein
MNTNIIEQTILYKGCAVKIRHEKVFLPFFGTTYRNQSMHTEYNEVPWGKLSKEFRTYLKENGFVTEAI